MVGGWVIGGGCHAKLCPRSTPRCRPPTKNAERIERYKLMIATSTGVVKDVYQVGAH